MKKIAMVFVLVVWLAVVTAQAAPFKVGVARGDITPPKSLPLRGQFQLRMAQGADTPLTVNVTALESYDGDKTLDSAVFVSLDLLAVNPELQKAVEEKVAARDPSIGVKKLVLAATHTHAGPLLGGGYPDYPKSDETMEIADGCDFTAERIAETVVKAWQSRKPGKMTWGLDFAVVAQSRRVVYADGRAAMYGKVDRPDFRGFEAMDDHDVGTLFFLDENDQLLSIVVNLSCPSQVVGHNMKYHADFWHFIRRNLAQRFGDEVVVLGLCGAAGDNTSRVMYRQQAVRRMNELRKLDEMTNSARQVDAAVAATWDVVKNTALADIPLMHRVETLQLPMRKVTEKEYEDAMREVEKQRAALKKSREKAQGEVVWMAAGWHGAIVRRYEELRKNPDPRFAATIHVIRLADTAICTNPFELYTDFGIQMKARSPANQTFVVQLVGNGSYLPTEKAVRGGGYSAVIQSNAVGPEGGQVLVQRTVEIMQSLWDKP